MKVVLFHHLQKGNAPEVARKVCLALHRNGMEVWADPRCLGLLKDMDFVCYAPFLEAIQDADVAVAIGGDGTILHCARHVWEQAPSCWASTPGGWAFWHPWSRIRSARSHGCRPETTGCPSGCCSEARCWTKQGLVSGN